VSGWARAWLLGLLAASCPLAAAAQAGPPGPYAVDLRGVTMAIPDDPAFLPRVPANTFVPSRAFGLDAGGHVYLMAIGAGRLGVGFTSLWARGTAEPPASSGSAATAASGLPRIHQTVRILSPHVSLNFGSTNGWSYVSGGIGSATIVSRAIHASADPDDVRESGRVGTLHVGGGARWFFSRHLAIGFDVRLHRLGKGEGTPAGMHLAAAAGLSLR